MADAKQEPSDPGFRVVDKRKGAPESTEEASSQAKEGRPPAESPQTPAQAEGADDAADLQPIDVYAVVQYCMSLLSGHAWQWMGLVVNPVTKQIERDLPQARVAIDCFEALFTQIEAGMPTAAAQQVRQALNDLRINFVRQSSPAQS